VTTTYRHVLGAPNKTPGTSIAPSKNDAILNRRF